MLIILQKLKTYLVNQCSVTKFKLFHSIYDSSYYKHHGLLAKQKVFLHREAEGQDNA